MPSNEATSAKAWMRNLRKDLLPKVIHPQGFAAARGFVAEGWFCSNLEEQGIPFIRSYEGAPADGAFIKNRDRDDWKSLDHSQRLLEGRSSVGDLLAFDVKYFAYLTDRHGLDYTFFAITADTKSRARPAVYIIVFQDVDAVAIVPRGVFESATHVTHGMHALFTMVPGWCYPFMVSIADLSVAIERLINSEDKNGNWYRNPTTNVELVGWRPDAATDNITMPEEQSGQRGAALNNSVKMTMNLWTRLSETSKQMKLGMKVAANPIAPLICDFMLDLTNDITTKSIRIELKLTTTSSRIVETGKRSPFTAQRLWHFLVWHDAPNANTDRETFFLIGRHEVQPGWYLVEQFPISSAKVIQGPHRIADLLEAIHHNADEAIEAADNALSELCKSKDIVELDTLLKSTIDDETIETLTENVQEVKEDDSEEAETENEDTESEAQDDTSIANISTAKRGRKRATSDVLAGSVQHAYSLPWFCDAFNKLAKKDGDLVCIPLDEGRIGGDCMVVAYKWPAQESLFLPTAWSNDIRHSAALVLELCDLSGGDKSWTMKGNQTHPVVMRHMYWRKPTSNKGTIIVGSTLRPELMQAFATYLFLPALLTTREKEGLVKARKGLYGSQDDGQEEEEGEQEEMSSNLSTTTFFRKEHFKEFCLEKPASLATGQSTRRIPLAGKEFLKAGVDPLKYLMTLDDIYANLRELLLGTAASIRIQSGHGTERAAQDIIKNKYLTTPEVINQETWQHGVYRRAAKHTKKNKQQQKE